MNPQGKTTWLVLASDNTSAEIQGGSDFSGQEYFIFFSRLSSDPLSFFNVYIDTNYINIYT